MLQEQFCNLEGCISLTEAQQRLQGGGLSASPRHTTRLLAFQQRGIRLTWSALEVFLQEAQSLLMRPEWLQSPLPVSSLQQMLEPAGLFLRESGGSCEVLSSDELWLESQETALVPLATQSLVQAMSGSGGAFAGDSWPDSWRVVADAEDSSRILEHLRSAFRQLRAQGASPAPLLWLALKRKRPEVTREVARLTHEYLDADAGRHLEALFSPRWQHSMAALRQMLAPGGMDGWDIAFLVGLMQILWEQPELRPTLLDLIEHLTPRWLEQPSWILPWWEDCLAQSQHLDGTLVQRLAQISLLWARLGIDLVPPLLRRLQKGLSLEEKLLAAWLLSQLSLKGEPGHLLLEHALLLAFESPLSGQALVRVQTILLNLGGEALVRLLEPLHFQRLDIELACWLVGEARKVETLALQAEATALRTLARGSRRMLRQMSAMGWLPQSQGQLEEDMRWNLIGFLEQELPYLEPPDDEWAIALLVQLDPPVVDRIFRKALQDRENSSRALPGRLHLWAQHCAAADQAPETWQIERLLGAGQLFPERPEVWLSWALLLRCSQIAAESQEILWEQLQQGQKHHPHRWPLWWLEIQKSSLAPVRDKAEVDLLEVLREDWPRQTVHHTFEALRQRISHWHATRPLMQVLSHRLLFLAPPQSPQRKLVEALSKEAQGDFNLLPQAWDAEQRDQALELVGQLALNPRLEPQLRRPARVRCWQFLQDWLDSVARGGNSYQHRSMPLWTTARQLLPGLDEAEIPVIEQLVASVISCQASCPERLRLLTHSDCLGLLLDWCSSRDTARAADSQRQVLQVLQDLLVESDPEYRPVAVGYLLSLKPEKLLPKVRGDWERLRQRWEGWLYGD